MNINDGDILVPGALVLAGGEPEGGKDNLVGVEHTLGKVAKHGGYNAVGDSSGRVVVAVPSAKLLKPHLPLLTLVTTAGGVTLLLTAGHDSENLC